jgi:hypothetical protein
MAIKTLGPLVSGIAQTTNVASPTATGTTGVRQITISTSAPSGGADGDVWLKHA